MGWVKWIGVLAEEIGQVYLGKVRLGYVTAG